MISRYFLLLLSFSIASAPFAASAQPAGFAEDAAVTYLERNWNRHGLASQADVVELVITDAVKSRHSGAISIYLHQGIDGIPVIDGQMTISVDEAGHVFHAAGRLVPDLASRTVHAGAGVSAVTAVETILQEAGFPAPEPFQVTEPAVGPTSKTTLNDGGGFTYLPVTAELVYIVDDNEDLRLAWDATAVLHGDDGAWRGLVDAGSGAILRLDDILIYDHFGMPNEDAARTVDEQPRIVKQELSTPGMLPRTSAQSSSHTGECYRVFAWPLIDPFHADPAWPDDGRTWECDPFDPVASPGGWHDDTGDGAPDYTITRGNNAHAYADWTSSPPSEPDGGADLHFDFPIDFNQEPEEYVDASVTNLFYWNNIIHDVMVHYGFDEAHGNFQQHNYTTDGLGGDYVNAEAQDANTLACNNANFTFTSDGDNPRMQMYLGCNHSPKMDGDLDNHVIIHEYGHGISTRMTGGPTTVGCLLNAEQMGEGWSDWYGLMLTQDETASDFGRNEPIGVGVFLFHDAEPNGIRPTPYSTDFAVNPTTYGDIGELIAPHGVGYAWATILWEVTWDLIDAYGFEQDIYNADALAGNTIMMNLVTEGLTLQPCSPGFVDGRDAIIAAVNVVYGDQDEQWRSDLKQALWGGFARRGLGYNADQGSSANTSDGVEDFTVPSVMAPDAITDLVAGPDGDFVTLTWTAPDDMDSDVFGYEVRRSSEPILNETDWAAATPVPTADMAPQAPGTAEEFVVMGLDFESTYHFSVRSEDAINTSDLSNSAEATTLAPPVADVPIDPIEITVPAEGSATHAFTISNAGPSTLRYLLGFRGTTEDVVSGRKAIARPAPREAHIPERDEEGALEDPGDPQILGEGGPDAFGYRWIDSNEPEGPNYSWVDISETGTELELGTDDYAIVDLPWNFPYYENTYDWVAIQSKGVLAFEDAFVGYANRPIPYTPVPSAIVAGYWDDLNPSSSSGGGAIYYDTLEDGRFVVSWVDVPHYPTSGSFTFQIILRPGGDIVYQYLEIDGNGTYDQSATIGVENLDGTDGLQIVYNSEYVEDELAVLFTSLWVQSSLSVGQIAAGNDETFTLTFDAAATSLDPGTYTANMTVTTNEEGDGLQEYVIPLTLTVEGIGTADDNLAFEGTYRLSAVTPNPISGLARTTLEVAGAQDVRIELFDVRGRTVATLFEGSLAARTAEEITLDVSALPAGVYVIRITGETFAETRRVTIVR